VHTNDWNLRIPQQGKPTMPSDLTNALKHLMTTFTVKDVMTPDVRLVCATHSEIAPAISAANPDFSVIPITRDGVLFAYFERDTRRSDAIAVSDLISDGTKLLDLVEIFEAREFSFVLTNRRINGYVHYSDLNHQIMKWTFYVMLEAVERSALDSLRPTDESNYLEAKLGLERFNQILQTYKRAGDNGRSLLTYLNIADILRLAVLEGTFQLDEKTILLMKDVRNWAAHVILDLPPVSAVRSLAVVKRECLRLLGSVQTEAAAGAA
jgi:hypothetical protein